VTRTLKLRELPGIAVVSGAESLRVERRFVGKKFVGCIRGRQEEGLAFFALKSNVDDPYLNQARLILLPRRKPLATVLAADARFTLIYQDALAVMFVKP
jgi:hypothetical protein